MKSNGYLINVLANSVFAIRAAENNRFETVASVRWDPTSGSSPDLTSISKALSADGYRGQPILVCLHALQFITTEPFPGSSSTTAYELETQCPIDAENMLVVRPGENELVLIGIRNRIEPLIDAMEQADITVGRVVPTSVAIAYSKSKNSKIPHQLTFIADVEYGNSELLVFENGRLREWKYQYSREDVIRFLNEREIDLDRAAVHLVGDLQQLPESLREDHDNFAFENSLSTSLLSARSSFGRSKDEIPFDLRSHFDSVTTSPLTSSIQAAVLGFVVLCLCSTTAFLIDASRNRELAAAYDARSQSVFRQVLPNHAPTRLIEKAISAEQTRQQELADLIAEYSVTNDLADSLADLVDSIPKGPKFETKKLTIEPQQLGFSLKTLDGEAMNQIKYHIDQQGRLELEEPSYGNELDLRFRKVEDQP